MAGLKLVGSVRGDSKCRISTYYVPSTDSTALYRGDVVALVPTTGAMDPLGEVPVVTRAATGNKLLGVVIGFAPDVSLPYTGKYRAASTNRYVQVCDDPEALYAAKEDAVGGAISQALIGAMSNVDIIVAAGDPITGESGTLLDSSSAAATAEDLKIVGVVRDGVNAGAQTGGATLLVRILSANAAITATDSQS